MAQIIVNSAMEQITDKTLSFLEPASASIRIISGLLSGGQNQPDSETILRTMWEQVGLYPQLFSLYIADGEGNFIQARQAPGRATRQILREEGIAPQEIWKFRDEQYEVTRILEKEPLYDPRVRPWYRAARKEMALAWSDLYIFSSNRKPGITASIPVNQALETNLVLGADITMESLGQFLENLTFTEGTDIIIYNQNEEIIAANRSDEIYRQEGEDFRPLRLSEIQYPWIYAGYEGALDKEEALFRFTSEGDSYFGNRIAFPEEKGFHWEILITIPEADILGDIQTTLYINLFISLILLIISLTLLSYLSKKISQPIIALAKETEHIKSFNLSKVQPVESPFREVRILNDSIQSMNKGLMAFQKYVPADIVRQLIQTRKEARLGGERERLTILFSAINGFTQAGERMSPETLFLHLSEYLDQVSKVIMEHRGTIDKYIEDQIMAFWGAPLPNKNHVENALDGALAIQSLISRLNTRWLGEVKPMMDTRIGIHTGSVMVGNVGSRDRMNYTILGHSVNIAKQLEQMNKTYGTDILVSEDTYEAVKDLYHMVPVDEIPYITSSKRKLAYWVLGSQKEPLEPHRLAIKDLCQTAFRAVQEKNWNTALSLYKELRDYPLTKQLSLTFIRRIEEKRN